MEKLVGKKVFKRDDDAFDYRPHAYRSTTTNLPEILIWNSNPLFYGGSEHNSIAVFTINELAMFAKNLEKDCRSGVTDFGAVYKGRLIKRTTKQVVHVVIVGEYFCKADQIGNMKFLAQVSRFRALQHPNVATVLGFCCEGYKRHRLLVYENMMPLGSLEAILHGPHKKALNWYTRMRIAEGVAKGLEYLHHKTNPPVLCQYLNTSTILLDKDYHPKLAGFGFPRSFISESECRITLRKSEYYAPDYTARGHFPWKSDIYTFGIVLLEIITGRKIIDNARPDEERELVAWAKTQFSDLNKMEQMADPMLQGQYPLLGLYKALALAKSCLHDDPDLRPRISQVVAFVTTLLPRRNMTRPV